MGHHEFAIVEHVMAHEVVDELGDALEEILRLAGELRQRFREAVRDLNVAPAELAHELHVVIARHAQRRAAGDGVHRELEHLGDFRPSIHEVADEDELAALRMVKVRSPAFRRQGVRGIQRLRPVERVAG